MPKSIANTLDLRDSEFDPVALHDAVVIGIQDSEQYDALGPIGPSTESTRRLFAAAARTRGLTAPQDQQINRLESRLESIDVPSVDVVEAKQRVTNTARNEAALRERIATLRGRLQAERESGGATDETKSELETAAATLSEVSTDRIAARQRLLETERTARKARTSREERMKLADRLANRRRDARKVLARKVRPEYDNTVERIKPLLPDTNEAPTDIIDHLTAVAIATVDIPIVIAAGATGITDEFAAASRLETPVWLV